MTRFVGATLQLLGLLLIASAIGRKMPGGASPATEMPQVVLVAVRVWAGLVGVGLFLFGVKVMGLWPFSQG